VIQKDLGSDYLSRINAVLTTVRGVNKTDVKTLGDRYALPAAMCSSELFAPSMHVLPSCLI
jgi:hypothetical protein